MRKRILELMPVLACLTLVLATAGPAFATFPGRNGLLAFTRQITTDIAGVFTAKPDGSAHHAHPCRRRGKSSVARDRHHRMSGR